jgi:plastocyanin
MNRSKMKLAGVSLIVLAAISMGLSASMSGDTAASGHTVTMAGPNKFAPRDVMIRAGDTVTWQNRDDHDHTVKSDTGVFDSTGEFPTGMPHGARWSWTVPIDAPKGKVYYYHCAFHGTPGDGSSYGTGMVGSITVK